MTLETLSFEQIKALYRRDLSITMDGSISTLNLNQCRQCDLKFYDPMRMGDRHFYESLQRHEWYYQSDKQEYDLSLAYFSENDSVLEIGAGEGAFAQKLRVLSYRGLELNEIAAAQARNRGLSVHTEPLEKHAAEHPGCYDVVCSFQVLEHIANVRTFLSSAVCCLKTGGLMIHSVPSEESFIGKQANNILNMPPHHATRWSDTALRNLARIFNLEFVALVHEPLADVHVGAYCAQRVQSFLNDALGRPQRTLDTAYLQLHMRALVRVLALPWGFYTKKKSHKPIGHSALSIYRKR